MFKVEPPSFTLDVDAPAVTRIAVVVEGLNPDGTSWAQIFAPGLGPESAGELLWTGVELAVEEDGATSTVRGCYDQQFANYEGGQR